VDWQGNGRTLKGTVSRRGTTRSGGMENVGIDRSRLRAAERPRAGRGRRDTMTCSSVAVCRAVKRWTDGLHGGDRRIAIPSSPR
jgi:hypothetical protein